MLKGYDNHVITRFLRNDERLIQSEEQEMPLVIEAKGSSDTKFLQTFLTNHSSQILADISTYGAVLLRGFKIESDQDFEKAVLSIRGFRGISEAFMSEQGRIPVDDLKYVLHTNVVYKTGGTLYLGGFHSENYYTPDVPSYISFCCLKPSHLGGETGLINMKKVYRDLSDELKTQLEKKSFFVAKWLVSEVAERYQVSTETIKKIAKRFKLPMVGAGKDQFIVMYKPTIFQHPETQEKSLQMNLFELPTLNDALRKCFMNDYQGKEWFWHRLVWRLPTWLFKSLETISVIVLSLLHSPKESLNIFIKQLKTFKAQKTNKYLSKLNLTRARSIFKENEIKNLAKSMRNYYSSCLWEKGDILLVDNRQVMHAGMPGSGPRLVRAMIGNPLEIPYELTTPGFVSCLQRESETVGFYMALGESENVPELKKLNVPVY